MDDKDFQKIYLYTNNGNGLIIDTPQNNMEDSQMYYTVSSNFRPIPPGINYLCINNQNNLTQNITEILDPYDKDINCLRLMVWTQPLPNTIPIRIYKNTDNTISFTPNSTNKEFYFSPLYFFKEIPENWKNSDGFCIPNSSENSLQSLRQCISSYSNKEQPTILTVLENNKKMKKNFLLFFTIFLLFIFFLIIIINKFWFRK